MKKVGIFLAGFLTLIIAPSLYAQRGKIIKAGDTILDRHQDGYISKTTAGFSSRAYNVPEFDRKMFGIPKVGGDVTGDNIGKSCGITDLIPDSLGYPVYATRIKDANNTLIFRFRVGDNNPSVEAWTILLDTDGLFGIGVDPNATADNPGFEIDITLIKNSNKGVFVYNIDGIESCPTPILNYSFDTHFQIAIADEVTCGNPDYFYDYYVPFADIAAALNINVNTGLRYAAVTNVSATCSMSGKMSDVSGVNDTDYNGCYSCMFNALVDAQCPTPIVDLCETCAGFEKDKVSRPTIHQPLVAGQRIIDGTTVEQNIFVLVQVFTNIGTTVAPKWDTLSAPRIQRGVYAIGTIWKDTLSEPLLGYDKVRAIAKKTATSVPCGGSGGNESSATSVTSNPLPFPVAQNQNLVVNEDNPLDIILGPPDPDNFILGYSIVTNPTHGTLGSVNTTTHKVTYVPNLNYNGPDSFTFRLTDGTTYQSTGTITITVNPVNDPPVANSQSGIITPEDTPKNITLTASDVDGDALTYIIVSPPSNGSVSLAGAVATYTPAANYFGQDSFTFKANDGTVDSNIATASITVTPVNDAPVANNQTISVAEDTPTGITLTASDVDGNALTFALVSSPAHGTLSGTIPNFTYTPALNYNGSDSFTFKANDGTVDSNTATISITVTPVNDAPVANNQSVTTAEDVAKLITLTGSDVEGSALTYSIVAGPAHGALSGTAPNLTYTPALNYNGSDNFTFKVNDGTVDSNIATVSITVTPVNDAPVASNQTISVAEDTPTGITVTATDVDGNALTFAMVSPPAHGTLSGTAPNFTYTPTLNYNGSDSFTFKANDGTVDSNTATISITVTPVNDAPVANNQSVTTAEDVAKAIILSGSDVDGDALTYSIVLPPAHGMLSGTAPNLTYTPNLNYNGSDGFTFKINDGTIDSNIATVSITITPVNDAPVADDQNVTTAEDVAKLITLSGSDVDGDALTYSVVAAPTHGTLSGAAPNLIYTPNLNYNGSDGFTFKVNDGTVDSNTATLSITITPVNDAPIANDQNATYDFNTPKIITLTASDADGDALSFSILTPPAHGSLSGTAPVVTYTPNAGYTGSDSFTFKVNDGTVDSNIATVSLIETPGSNSAPVANNQTISVAEDTPTGITLTASDVDGNALTFALVSSPAHGTLSGTIPNFTYTPALNYNGSDSFTFKANDGTVDSNTATISITVTPVNDAPVANNQSVTTAEDVAKLITLTGSDVEGSALTYSIVAGPAHGALSGTAPNLTYTPALNYNGSDNFTFKVNDGTVDSNIATVSITVTPVNDAPVASNQTISVAEDTPTGITVTATDVDGNALTFAMVSPPAHGTLSGTAPNFTYTPTLNYNGSDSFTFKANDGTVDSNTATISITVTPVNDAPVANNQSVTTAEDVAKAIILSGSDVDGDALTYSIVLPPAHGMLSGTAPNLTYTPNLNYNGSDGFTFKINDGTIDSNIATVSITITPVNDAPVADDQNVTTAEDVAKLITLSGSDVDGDALTYSVVAAPTHGTLSGAAPNLIYTPNLNFNGSDGFTFKVNDGTVDSNAATLSITITPVNDAPIADNQSVTLAEDGSAGIVLTGSDVDGDVLTYSVVTQPAHGALSGTAPNLTYTAALYYNGSDNFTFKANDGTVDSNIATVSITLTPVNHAPVAISQTGGVTLVENSAVPITLLGSDVDGNALSYIIVTQPSHGTLSGTGPNVTYTPDVNYSGPDSFTFKVNDGVVDSNIATVDIIVTPLNNAPVADSQSVTTQEDVPVVITLTSSDSDGDPRTYSVVATPIHGTLTGTAPNLTYTPASYFNGSDSLTFKVNDGIADSKVAKVSITVTPVNNAPVITVIPDLYTKEDSVRLVCLNVVDVDGDQIIFGQPTNSKGGGTMTKASAPYDFCYTFTPALNYNGESIWDMSVCDTGGLCGSTRVKLIITPVNDPPYAANDEVEVNSRQATAFNVMENDFVIAPPYKEFYDIYVNDPNYSDALTMTTTPLSGPFNGTVQMSADGTVSYTPKFDYVGPDSIKYKICDSGNLCATAVAFIKVGYPPFKIYEGVSPNGDDVNDYWRIDGIELFPNNLVRVYDRFNNVVYETSGYSNEKNNWQGQANHGLVHGTLSEGTYFYTVDLGNGDHALSGYVELKRH